MSIATTQQIRDLFPEFLKGQGREERVKYAKALHEAQFSEIQANQLVPQYKVQKMLRPLYGKGTPQAPSIGHHPDFEHLLGTELEEFCPITTMFMDLESSTRLGILYEPSQVAKIKNAFICMAIEAVKSFDGHVHRIMGDAVMAFFGGKKGRAEAAAIDAINCASLLQLLVRESVIPTLQKNGFDDTFGIRIGLDYGPAERVLWRSYGYPGMEEVTATSFYVDVASKLQHAAGRHEIMLGNSLKDFLDFPEVLLQKKTVIEDGKTVTRTFLLPNITDADSNPINYRQHLLNWETYLRFSPLAISAPNETKAMPISATLHGDRDAAADGVLISTGTLGQKGKQVRFFIRKLPFVPHLPYSIHCTVENHGQEALSASETLDNHETKYDVTTSAEHRDHVHWEHLGYRGLHFLTVEVRNRAGVIARGRYGVYVE